LIIVEFPLSAAPILGNTQPHCYRFENSTKQTPLWKNTAFSSKSSRCISLTRLLELNALQKRENTVSESWNEHLVEKEVTYSVTVGDRIYIVEGVPAWVNEETGEQLFAPATVESIQQIIVSNAQPARMLEVPVYRYRV
jgi:hypothetical protein